MSVSNKKRAAYPFYWYTFLFALMVLVIYGYFFVAQKSFIWERDGFSQHYLIFKEYLEIVRDFLQQPSLGFKLWDWNIGLGADTIHSYGYYVVGDPFVYLGLLFPASQTELAFHVLILLRLYAIGAVFLIFCRKIGIAMPGALVGRYTECHTPSFLSVADGSVSAILLRDGTDFTMSIQYSFYHSCFFGSF